MGITRKFITTLVFTSSTFAAQLPARASGAALQQGLEKVVGQYAIAPNQPTVCLGGLAVSYDAEGATLKAGDFHTFVRINLGEVLEEREGGKFTIQDEVIFRANKLLHVRIETERDGVIAAYVTSRRRRQYMLQPDGSALRTTEVASDGFVLSCEYQRSI